LLLPLVLPVEWPLSRPEDRMERGLDADLQDLMTRLAQGDRSAFHPAFEILWPILRRLAGRHLPSAEAEDAAQEALVKLFRQAARFDSSRSALAWALGVAGYEVRTARRRRQRRRESPAKEEALGECPDPAKSPEEILLARDLENTLRETLGALRPRDAETLRLYALGLRPPVAPVTFRKRVERALSRLRQAWRTTDARF
jgi:RNA polymerase sigma-70 factor (ECF subfamily)